jgi:hypothetical protein
MREVNILHELLRDSKVFDLEQHRLVKPGSPESFESYQVSDVLKEY